MMNRRRFLLTSPAGVLAATMPAEAQPERNRPRVAVLFSAVSTAGLAGAEPGELHLGSFPGGHGGTWLG